jgi:hypothetical protein
MFLYILQFSSLFFVMMKSFVHALFYEYSEELNMGICCHEIHVYMFKFYYCIFKFAHSKHYWYVWILWKLDLVLISETKWLVVKI